MSPQIAGRWLSDPSLYAKVYPFSLRPQAHEIIRTWAFDTIVKSHFHFDTLPWKDVLISGWGIAGEGGDYVTRKISKSRGGGPMPPMEMIETYSADAVRYWAASTSPGKDAVISEEKIQLGAKLVNKLWNVAVFSQRFLTGVSIRLDEPDDYSTRGSKTPPSLSPADRWILSMTQRLIRRVTELFDAYEYATAKSETENFFWVLADNYLEMAKMRLYEPRENEPESARYTLFHVFRTVLQLFAPIFPFVTEEIYQHLFAETTGAPSIHTSRWPEPDPALEDSAAEELGELLIDIARHVRGYKSGKNLPLRTEIPQLELATGNAALADALRLASADLMSITRAQEIIVKETLSPELQILALNGKVQIAISAIE
jgi:valyl-tRNA synthetase